MGELTISSDSEELIGSDDLIIFTTFLEDYPDFLREPLALKVKFVPCDPGAIETTFTTDLGHEIGSDEMSVKLSPFKAVDEESC